jgi:rfaE bifunctional protein nucleotidyltransferase chain/domain
MRPLPITIKPNVVPLEGAVLLAYEARSMGMKVVFTNGCFDILHRGHLHCLEVASRLGSLLIVGVNSDRSVRELKGPDRPVNTLEDRMYLLAAWRCVDVVFPFDSRTCHEEICRIHPDIYVKGGDYKDSNQLDPAELEALKHVGASIHFAPLCKGYSTTSILNSLK